MTNNNTITNTTADTLEAKIEALKDLEEFAAEIKAEIDTLKDELKAVLVEREVEELVVGKNIGKAEVTVTEDFSFCVTICKRTVTDVDFPEHLQGCGGCLGQSVAVIQDYLVAEHPALELLHKDIGLSLLVLAGKDLRNGKPVLQPSQSLLLTLGFGAVFSDLQNHVVEGQNSGFGAADVLGLRQLFKQVRAVSDCINDSLNCSESFYFFSIT